MLLIVLTKQILAVVIAIGCSDDCVNVFARGSVTSERSNTTLMIKFN